MRCQVEVDTCRSRRGFEGNVRVERSCQDLGGHVAIGVERSDSRICDVKYGMRGQEGLRDQDRVERSFSG